MSDLPPIWGRSILEKAVPAVEADRRMVTLLTDKIAKRFDDYAAGYLMTSAEPAPEPALTLEGLKELVAKLPPRPPYRSTILPAGLLSRLPSDAGAGPAGLSCFGIPAFEHHMTRRRQHRKPRSKKRRIQKKAAKYREGSPWWTEEPDPSAYMLGEMPSFEIGLRWT